MTSPRSTRGATLERLQPLSADGDARAWRDPGAWRTAARRHLLQGPGAGIGLFVCRQLVEAMGGRIWAVPREGRIGSEFGFRLPAMADEEALET